MWHSNLNIPPLPSEEARAEHGGCSPGLLWLEELVDINPLKEAYMPEVDPILGQAVVGDEDELGLNVCVFPKMRK